MDKQAIRTTLIQQRKMLSKTAIETKSNQIMKQLIPYLKDYKCIAIYMPCNGEVDLSPLLTLDHKFYIPKVEKTEMNFYEYHQDQLIESSFHILEPTNHHKIKKEQIDCMIVPLVAFDSNKNRIGYGKGYYDRYLQTHTFKTIGVAYDFQRVEQIEPDPFDKKLDKIITEIKIYE
ncbi:MAG: 5-formyltetrahydrofolate cyclo-ligase [Erysipelotrichaceae bacterium]